MRKLRAAHLDRPSTTCCREGGGRAPLLAWSIEMAVAYYVTDYELAELLTNRGMLIPAGKGD